MAANYKQHSKDWDGGRPSPPHKQLIPQFSRLPMDSVGPSSSQMQFVPRYNRHSKDSERPSPNPSQLVPQFNRLSMGSVRPSSSQRQFVPRYNRHSKDSERPSPNTSQLLPQFNRLSMDSARPSSSQRQFVPRYNRHSKDSERPSPNPSQLVPRFNRLSMDSARPSSNQKQFVPRYNRHSKDSDRPSPSPNPREVVPHYNRHFTQKSSRHYAQSISKIVYPGGAITKWFAIDLNGVNHFTSSVCLKPISLESIQTTVKNPLVLVNSHQAKDKDEEGGIISRSPWESVAEKVWPDLLSCLEIVRNKMECEKLEEVKPTLVARFGKLIFSSISGGLDNVIKGQVSEASLRQLRKLLYTTVPTAYMEKIIREVVPKIGVDFEEEKDIYHVRLSDSTLPNSLISCKCSLKEDRKLELYKVKLIHRLRYMLINISCLDKDVDLRLMLSGKRILTALSDDEMERISKLINSAVLDPNTKGGLRWPQEAYSQSSRYNVVGVWHTISKVYKSPSLMLEIRHADRYNFETATGEATTEVALKLKRMVSELVAQKLEKNSIYTMFKDTLRMIWEHFLCCEQFLT